MPAKNVQQYMRQLTPPPADSGLDRPAIARVMNRAAFLTFTQNGVQKRLQTTRAGLEYLRNEIEKALDCPVSNINGIETGYSGD